MLTSRNTGRVKVHSDDSNNAFIPTAMSVYGWGPAFVRCQSHLNSFHVYMFKKEVF